MLLDNLLMRKNKNSIDNLNCSFEQKKMLEEKPYLLKKSLDAQRMYNRGFLYIMISIALIIILGITDTATGSNLINATSLSLLTIIAVPLTVSVLSNAFTLMLEVDNETIYRENDKD
ncbi:hypothetical protein EY688_10420 [Enterococcus casseliflavus]|uniref:hypothetical protein n=1 Tax=Enterococcus casseliflavus TaxID=37734 RepID=UPI001AD72D0D|nr:hypothetical protein [Enterococcus casseliflavus]MBO6349578.1 hypothetical protein [Enterococcus casseliflavus]MBO6368888.1 hypothetical protein [Enterococcus casseliflavus]